MLHKLLRVLKQPLAVFDSRVDSNHIALQAGGQACHLVCQVLLQRSSGCLGGGQEAVIQACHVFDPHVRSMMHLAEVLFLAAAAQAQQAALMAPAGWPLDTRLFRTYAGWQWAPESMACARCQ